MPQENKLYLNIQEQVEKNKKDILDIQQGATVLADFGIKVIGQVDESSELPDPRPASWRSGCRKHSEHRRR